MKTFITATFSLLFFVHTLYAQKYDNSWMFGYDGLGSTLTDSFALTKINFQTNPITLDSLERDYSLYFTNTSLSDPLTGELQFYTNGISVRDKTHSIMQNGDSINYGTNVWKNTRIGGYRCMWGALALPVIGQQNQYYLFHLRLQQGVPVYSHLPLDLLYTKIDMTLNNGKGRAIAKNQSILHDSLANILTATKHANGRDWWVLQQSTHGHRFHLFLLDPTGIHAMPPQVIGNPIYSIGEGGGFFSPDGSKYVFFDADTGFYLFDFDRCTGRLSNRRLLPFNRLISAGAGFCDLKFSPNSQLLYLSNFQYITQYDLNAPDIAASQDTVAVYDGFMQGNNQVNFFLMQNAPNDKIYVAAISGGYLSVIDEPNIRGIGCHVIQHGLKLRGYNSSSMPNFPNYRLGALAGSGCDSLTVATQGVDRAKEACFRVFPNPANNQCSITATIANEEDAEITFIDLLGRVSMTQRLPKQQSEYIVDISSLYSGVYVVKIAINNVNLSLTKLTIIK